MQKNREHERTHRRAHASRGTCIRTRAMLHQMADSKDVRRRATYEDVLQAPEHMVAEIIDGELFLSPRHAYRHAIAGSALPASLIPRFQYAEGGPGGWWFLIEPELHFGDDVLV